MCKESSNVVYYKGKLRKIIQQQNVCALVIFKLYKWSSVQCWGQWKHALPLSLSLNGAAPVVSVRERSWGHEPSNTCTQLQLTTHSFPQMDWATEHAHTHTHTHIYINKCSGIHSGSQKRSSFTQNPLQEQPVLFVAEKPVIGWILKQSISGCRNEPSILEVNTLLFMRGVKMYQTRFSKPNLPEVKHTLAFKLFRAELDIGYILKLVESHWLIIKI